MTLSAMNYLLYRNISVFNGSVLDDIIIKYMKFHNLPTYVLYIYMYTVILICYIVVDMNVKCSI